MNLEIFRAPTLLTSPAIPTKNLPVKFGIGHGSQPQARAPCAQIVHRAAPDCSINLGLSSAGKSWARGPMACAKHDPEVCAKRREELRGKKHKVSPDGPWRQDLAWHRRTKGQMFLAPSFATSPPTTVSPHSRSNDGRAAPAIPLNNVVEAGA